jgi:hypothetical protein
MRTKRLEAPFALAARSTAEGNSELITRSFAKDAAVPALLKPAHTDGIVVRE